MAVPAFVAGRNYQLRQVGKNTAQYSVNVLNYYCTSVTGTPTSLDEAARQFDLVVAPAFKPLLSSSAQYWGMGVRDKTGVGSLEYYCANARGAGTGAASLLPTQAAPLVSWRTDNPGRAGRGRTYLPFAPTDALSNDASLTPAYTALVAVWIATIFPVVTIVNAAITGTAVLQLSIIPKVPVHHYPVTTANVREFTATQRRRGELTKADVDPFSGSVVVI